MSDEAKKPADLYDVLLMMLDQTAAIAWQKMGLQPDFITGEIHTDLEQAKSAIDLVAHLVGILEGKMEEEDRRELHNLLSNLRVNYVEKSK